MMEDDRQPEQASAQDSFVRGFAVGVRGAVWRFRCRAVALSRLTLSALPMVGLRLP